MVFSGAQLHLTTIHHFFKKTIFWIHRDFVGHMTQMTQLRVRSQVRGVVRGLEIQKSWEKSWKNKLLFLSIFFACFLNLNGHLCQLDYDKPSKLHSLRDTDVIKSMHRRKKKNTNAGRWP